MYIMFEEISTKFGLLTEVLIFNVSVSLTFSETFMTNKTQLYLR